MSDFNLPPWDSKPHPNPDPDPEQPVAIHQIKAQIWTADKQDAGTGGRVYLGVAGREFFLHKDSNDFLRGAKTTFILGDEHNITHSTENDPRTPPFTWTEGQHPVYLRLEPEGTAPAWLLEWARIEINPGAKPPIAYQQPALAGLEDGHQIWLGSTSGKIVYLTRSTSEADGTQG